MNHLIQSKSHLIGSEQNIFFKKAIQTELYVVLIFGWDNFMPQNRSKFLQEHP